jgi:hypothetical protein
MNLELRFPLIDELRFPFGSVRNLRGTVFFDAGTAYVSGDVVDRVVGIDNVGEELFYSRRLETYRSFGPFDPLTGQFTEVSFEPFKIWDSDNNRMQDLRASWGIGFNFLLGGLELHWDFAHQLPYTDFRQRCVSDQSPDRENPVPCTQVLSDTNPETVLVPIEINDSTVRTNFWIGFSF